MGGSTAGNFGNTLGSRLDVISDVLTVASLIPGLDTAADILSVPVDLLRGDFVSAGLSALGAIPLVGEVADTTKLARFADKAADTAMRVKNVSNPIVKSIRVGKATKLDAHHSFPNIIDNYAGKAKKFSLKGADGKTRSLYQIEGGLNGKKGIFEWIYEKGTGVTHRRFIPNGKITGKPNSK